MKNKSQLLNILLAAIIIVLVYQLNNPKSADPIEKTSTLTALKSEPNDSVESKKISVGKKAHIMPKPALVIGSYNKKGEPNIMTAAWVGICNSKPLSIAVSIRPKRLSYENIMNTKAFTINVPSTKHVAHVDYVGNITGYDEDKFKKLGLTPVKGDYINAPYIKEFPIVIECEVTATYDLGSHTQFIGKIIDTKVEHHLLDKNGHVNIDELRPVIYEQDYYYGYGEKLAKPWDIFKLFKDGEEPSFLPADHITIVH